MTKARRPATTLAILLALLLAACKAASSASQPRPSLDVTPEPSPTQSPASATPPTASPTAALVPHLRLGPNQVARVLVDGLAVRQAPSVDAPLVDGWQFFEERDNTWEKITDALRFDAGHYVYLGQGPLLIDGRQWFLIDNLPQPGDDRYAEVLRWDIQEDPDDGWDGSAWLAGSDGGERLLEPGTGYEFPASGPSPIGKSLSVAHGVGSGRTKAWTSDTATAVSWAAADPEAGTCNLRIILQPDVRVIADQTVRGVARDQAVLLTEEEQGSPSPEDRWLNIETDCSWSLTVGSLI